MLAFLTMNMCSTVSCWKLFQHQWKFYLQTGNILSVKFVLALFSTATNESVLHSVMRNLYLSYEDTFN
jgi:hypothetical protein